MVSNTLGFFRIDFLFREEFNSDISIPARDVDLVGALSELAWRGPYSHVISPSFNLVHLAML
jgi:hypothetical protein